MYKLKIVELPKPLNIKTQINFPEVVLGKMQEKTIIPKTTFQEVLPDKNYDGLSKVNVEAVTKDIDENIKSENIKKNVSILGVQGNIEELKGTKIEITKNGTYIPEEPYNAFTEVVTNVEADVSEYFDLNISSAGSTTSGLNRIIKKCPPVNISGTSTYRMFAECAALTEVPQLDTSNVTDMEEMFNGCYSLTTIPQLDTSNVTNMKRMFNGCRSLTEVPQLDTSKVTNMSWLFRFCPSLTNLPLLNATSVINIELIFNLSSSLRTFGGLQSLGQAYDTTKSANYSLYKLNVSECKDLTHDSLMNVINNLYDIATKGVKTQQLVLGSTNLAKLTAEEIAIATNKGFSVS